MTSSNLITKTPFIMQPILVGSDEASEQVQSRFLQFLQTYTEGQTQVYFRKAQQLVIDDKTTLTIQMRHLSHQQDLLKLVYSNFYKYEPYMVRAVKKFVDTYFHDYSSEKQIHIGFSSVPSVQQIRQLKTTRIGKLISVTGTVTKSTEVRPQLRYGSFKCVVCNYEVKDVVQQFKFTQPQICPNQNCGNKSQWELIIENSKFSDWQKIRVQEHSSDIPAGSMPRSIDVILRHQLVDTAKPGQRLIFTGTLLSVPDITNFLTPGERHQVSMKLQGRRAKDKQLDAITGLKQLGVRELNYKLVFIAYGVSRYSQYGYRDEQNELELTNADKEMIENMRIQPDLYSRMARCIAPSIFGHQDVKRGILLMLLGGVNKSTSEGMKLRGDINICIVGDPSVAKSQFLKYVCNFLPRAVYTSGKASTAAGLTAAVQRDIETGEFCIEAGALMLADNGICCIDEFDKMDSKDQVAIHEAMEQQTISIAKAGIQATLNARCSILAAANPKYGRYDKSQELRKNVQISPPLMSRFDLFFVIVDECEDSTDQQIASHIVRLHQFGDISLEAEFPMENLQKYIMAARMVNPRLSTQAVEVLREQYKMMRQVDSLHEKNAYRITVRQLESCVRLSEAIARLNFDLLVRKEYVVQACRLLQKSIIHVEHHDIDLYQGLDQSAMTEYRQEQARVDRAAREAAMQEDRRHITLSFEEYQRISKWIALFLRDREQEDTGERQQNIIDEYINQHLQGLTSEEEVEQQVEMINGVIQRLISRDRILVVVEDNEDRAERTLKVHWNYVA